MMDAIIGTIVFVMAAAPVPDGYLLAEGQCLPIAQYQALADALHDGDNWPYGQCGADSFRLPNLMTFKVVAPRYLTDTDTKPVIKAQ